MGEANGVHPEVEAKRETLRAFVAERPALAPFDVAGWALPSIRLATRRAPQQSLRGGASRIGGLPDVPPDFEWPRWTPRFGRKDRYGQDWRPSAPTPLGFIAQIDLSEMPHIDELLPSSGWLNFFYDRYCEPWGFDPKDRGCSRVVYANCDRSLLSVRLPPDDADLDHVAATCAMEPRVELTLPDLNWEGPIAHGTPEYEQYDELQGEIGGDDGIANRLLGHPQIIQNAMELECQLASNGVYCGNSAGYESDEAKALASGAADWRLLLQIDSDEEGPGWMWGDCGRIYFWIRKQDLAAQRFDATWLNFQCS